MNTPTHFLITAAARKALPSFAMPRSAVWIGSVAPDIPLYLLFGIGLFWFRTVRGMEFEAIWGYMWSPEGLYFNDPWWKAAHNFFHAPPIALAGMIVGRWTLRYGFRAGHWIFWFFAACGLHSAIDILTHNDDGPLLLWPIDWELRFSSPISYWDPDHYGLMVSAFEGILDLLLIGYLAAPAAAKVIGYVTSMRKPGNPPSGD